MIWTRIWYRNLIHFKKTWMVSFFWIILEPIFYLSAIGYGLGSFVDNINGLSYIEFFFGALICNSAVLVAFFESTYGCYTKLQYQNLYASIIMTPIGPVDIGNGEIVWGATKGTLSALGILLVGWAFGLTNFFTILPILTVVFIGSLIFSAFGLLVTTQIKNYDQIIYFTSGIIIPMTLFCGTYFPLDSMPVGLRYIMYLLPLTHMVELTRNVEVLNFSFQSVINLAAMFIFAILLSRIALSRLQKRLIS